MDSSTEQAAWQQPSRRARDRAAVERAWRARQQAIEAALPKRYVPDHAKPVVVKAEASPERSGFDCVASLRMSVMSVAIAAAAVGCAQAPTQPDQPLVRVQPMYRVAHSDAAQVSGMPQPTVVRQGEVDARPRPVPVTAVAATAAAGPSEAERAALAQADLTSRAMKGEPEALHVLGVQLAREGQLAEGIAALRLANAKAPGQPRLLNNLGHALKLQGQTEQARSMFEQALLADPTYDYARANLAMLEPASLPTPAEAVAVALEQSPAPALVDVVAAARPTAAKDATPARDVEALLAIAPTGAGAASPAALSAVREGPALQAVALAPIGSSGSVDQRVAALAWADAPVAGSAGGAFDAPQRSAVDLKSIRVELVNGNGITGAALALRGWLRERGFQQVRTANAEAYNRPMTQVFYQKGEGRLAREVSRRLPLSTELVELPAGSMASQVRVVLGHDLRGTRGLQALAEMPFAHPALKAAAGHREGVVARAPTARELAPTL
ncbi:LytR C-terminal domain-containing protein [Leptothrix sp. BB-4]